MILYRVMSSRDILAGKTGEVIASLRMADNRAQDLANETGFEVTVTSFNTVTKGFEFVKAYYPNAAIKQAKEEQERVARAKAFSDKMRRNHEEYLRRVREDHARAQNAYNSKPVKTKLTVAMSNLQLTEGFDQLTLKSNYRKLVMKHHPDRGGTVKNFQYIQKSYEYILELKGWK